MKVGQKIQWSKEKGQRDNNDLPNTTQNPTEKDDL